MALMTLGCADGHSRPIGHDDVTFGISPAGDALVFNAAGEGECDLFLFDLKRSRVTRIAATPDYELDPEFSPDGKSVVYAAGKPGDRADHIFLRSLDGKAVKQLSTGAANDAAPSFSPDGSLIVFTRDQAYRRGGSASNRGPGKVLCVIKVDGTGSRQITKDGSRASDPHFSPDGQTIVFWNENGLASVAADGSASPRPLATQGGREASYSPDGHSIAFSNGRYAPDHRIFIANADGTSPKKLTAPGGGCFRPAFTPDGKRVVFFLESWPNGPSGVPKESVWKIDIEGGRSREIADYTLFDAPLSWRPRSQSPAKESGLVETKGPGS